MKLLSKKICFLFFICAPFILYGANPKHRASCQEFLLTFPRSGTNLLTSSIQALTGKPIGAVSGKLALEAVNRLDLDLDYSKPPIYRSHAGAEVARWNKNGNKLLFVLRNYKESIQRHSGVIDPVEFSNLFLCNSKLLQQYIDNARTFHNWDKDSRLLIYYEDLISDPVREMKKVLCFLGEEIPDYLTEEFLQDVAAGAMRSYHRQHIATGGSQSKGRDLEYHSKQFPDECLEEIDDYMKTQFPLLWENYLSRYASKNCDAK